MLAAIRPFVGSGLFRSGIERIVESSLRLVSKAPKTKVIGAAETGLFSGLKQLAISAINQVKSFIKPLLVAGPLAWLFSYAKSKENKALAEIDEKFSEAKSSHELMKHHNDLEQKGVYQFIPAQSAGAKPLVIVGLGTMQEFSSKEAGLMQVVAHLRKNHPDTHVLVLKAPDAGKALKHLFCLEDDASANTDVKTKENTKLIEDVVKGRGSFNGVQVSGVCPVGFSWGAGMLCQIRKQGVFDGLRVPILGTATLDPIQPGLENLGDGLTELGAGKEPNLHCYQESTYYGLNGACAKDLGFGDEVYRHDARSHEELDNDPWSINKVCGFLDKVLTASPCKKF